MKRPPGLWLLLSAGVLCLSLQSVYGLRATELIFGKTTSTTSTTEVVPEGEGELSKDGASTEAADAVEPKSNLTGNPQLDYIFDPNLPRELNGYNLSSYPFYNSMPEDIDFKCDGLHDGFYASVPHKCQVYHHCLFGTRYDFLCANYTAFDQKTFICHFVSEVDCNNSRKYWHRNDALYQAASTTTLKPPPLVISPALNPANRRPSPSVRQRRPSRRRPQYDYYDEEYEEDDREEYYEEPRPRSRRRKRPRPRPRPVYEDDYEEYEDDRYERPRPNRYKDDDERKSYDRRESYDREEDNDRKSHDRREPDDRRGADNDRKPYDRREPDDRRVTETERKPYDRREAEPTDKTEPEDRRVVDRKPYDRRDGDDRRSGTDKKHDRRESDDRQDANQDRKTPDRKESNDRRSSGDDRKPHDRREHDDRRSGDTERKSHDRRHEDRPIDGKRYKDDRRRDYDDRSRYDKDDEYDYRYDRDRRRDDNRKRRPSDDDRYERDDRRSSQDKRRYENRRPANDSRSHDRPRKNHRRPYDDDIYEDEKEEDKRVHDRPRKNDKKDNPQPQDNKPASDTADKSLVKPSSGSSVYNQPRLPPRVRPPVPKTEQNKFAYKPTAESSNSKMPEDDEEYFEEDYEEEPPAKRPPLRSTPKPEPETSESRRPSKVPSNVERNERKETRRPLGQASRPRVQMFKRPAVDPFDDYEEDKPLQSRPHTTKPRHDQDNRQSKINFYNKNRPAAATEDYPDRDREEARPLKNPANIQERNTNQTPSRFIPKEQRQRNEFRERSKLETSSTATTSSSTTTTTTTTPPPPPPPAIKESSREPIVRVVKRPFLPSRGGNPYSSRGLQPVGAKALDNAKSPPPDEKEIDTLATEEDKDLPEIEEPLSTRKSVSPYQPEASNPTSEDYDEPNPNYKPNIVPIRASEEDESNTFRSSEAEESHTIPNGRQFPQTEQKSNSFVINEQPLDDYNHRSIPGESQKTDFDSTLKSTKAKEPEPPEEKTAFKPSPVLIKVPIRLKYSNPIGTEDEEEFRPVSNRPQTALRGNVKHKNYQEPRTTEKANTPERNPLDITENEYDVTLNDALNPTIPNLPVRNFPTGFGAASDYTFSSFSRPRYDVTLNQASENRYQVRAPSQRVETVVQPYVTGGKKLVNPNAQYNIASASAQVFQTQNFRTSPHITHAQTHAFYPVY